jgi:hypothetical protein
LRFLGTPGKADIEKMTIFGHFWSIFGRKWPKKKHKTGGSKSPKIFNLDYIWLSKNSRFFPFLDPFLAKIGHFCHFWSFFDFFEKTRYPISLLDTKENRGQKWTPNLSFWSKKGVKNTPFWAVFRHFSCFLPFFASHNSPRIPKRVKNGRKMTKIAIFR